MSERERLKQMKETLREVNPSPTLNFTLAMFEMLIRHDQQLEEVMRELKNNSRWHRVIVTSIFSMIVVLVTTLLVVV